MSIRVLKLLPFVLLLAACGGSGGKPPPSGNPSNPTGPDPVTVEMGGGTGSAFQSGVIQVSSSDLSAGGSTTLSVTLQRSDGSLYSETATVTFNSSCIAQGLATVTSPVEITNGIATTTYSATGCSGTDVITARTTVDGTVLSATGSVNVAPAAIGSIVFVSATPENIALKGSGSSEHPETAVVVFRVLDSSSGPRANAVVNFKLDTDLGGVSLSPAQGMTNADGRVQTVVQGGTVSTPLTVTATVADTSPAISTQSSVLTVTTGVADQDSFSMSVECQNVEAWARDGVVVPVSVWLSDRFNNPVPDGTAVTFNTEGGSIQSRCITQDGTCKVNWTSSNPRPVAQPRAGTPDRPGRSTLLAMAVGEESFTDRNGNGVFDDGDDFVDLAERYRDDNENDEYDYANGERIYDFNNNGTRDAADGVFNGVLCKHGTLCDATKTTTGISAQNLIIMSDGTAHLTPTNAAPLAAIAQGATQTYAFLFSDVNGNPLPAGTSISMAANGTGLSVGAPSSYTVPCTTEPTGYQFAVSASATAASGNLTFTVETPNGLRTVLMYGLPVN